MNLTAHEIWIGFTKLQNEAECKICRTRLKRTGSQTTSLRYHLVNLHKDEAEHIKKFGSLPNSSSSLDDFFSVKRKLNKKKMAVYNFLYLIQWECFQDFINDALVALISKCNLSLNIVSSPEFIAYSKALNENYAVPSPTALSNIINAKVDEDEKKLKVLLKNQKIS